MPAPRIGYHRVIASTTLALLHSSLALSYAVGSLSRGPGITSPNAVRVSIVSYIDSLGPVWQIGFGSTALMLVIGLINHRYLAVAHALGGAAVAVFATALWFGFAFSDPRPAVLSPIAYTCTVVWHLTIGVTYARLSSLHRMSVVVTPPPSTEHDPPARRRHRRAGR